MYGLHPYDVFTRVQRALDGVRPYLGSHGGDVELIDVTDEGVVHLQLLGSCDGCPSSSVTLELAVKDAVQAAAPEVTTIEVRVAEAVDGGSDGFIPVSALRARITQVAAPEAGRWEPLPELADLAAGGLRSLEIAGMQVVVARVGSERYAYLDRCARCARSLSAARLERRLGASVSVDFHAGDAVLRCPNCGAHFDVRHAGAGLDRSDEHLEPLPLLVRDGVLAVAIPTVSA